MINLTQTRRTSSALEHIGPRMFAGVPKVLMTGPMVGLHRKARKISLICVLARIFRAFEATESTRESLVFTHERIWNPLEALQRKANHDRPAKR